LTSSVLKHGESDHIIVKKKSGGNLCMTTHVTSRSGININLRFRFGNEIDKLSHEICMVVTSLQRNYLEVIS
jgi:hypothetical protein